MDAIAQLDAFFAGKPDEWTLCESLRRALMARWPDTTIRVMKTCVSFDGPKPYCYVSLQPKSRIGGAAEHFILLSISLAQPSAHPRILQLVQVSKRRFTAHIAVTDALQIDEELLDLIGLSRR